MVCDIARPNAWPCDACTRLGSACILAPLEYDQPDLDSVDDYSLLHASDTSDEFLTSQTAPSLLPWVNTDEIQHQAPLPPSALLHAQSPPPQAQDLQHQAQSVSQQNQALVSPYSYFHHWAPPAQFNESYYKLSYLHTQGSPEQAQSVQQQQQQQDQDQSYTLPATSLHQELPPPFLPLHSHMEASSEQTQTLKQRGKLSRLPNYFHHWRPPTLQEDANTPSEKQTIHTSLDAKSGSSRKISETSCLLSTTEEASQSRPQSPVERVLHGSVSRAQKETLLRAPESKESAARMRLSATPVNQSAVTNGAAPDQQPGPRHDMLASSPQAWDSRPCIESISPIQNTFEHVVVTEATTETLDPIPKPEGVHDNASGHLDVAPTLICAVSRIVRKCWHAWYRPTLRPGYQRLEWICVRFNLPLPATDIDLV